MSHYGSEYSLQCLESTEGGESDTELADCNFHKDKQCFFPP